MICCMSDVVVNTQVIIIDSDDDDGHNDDDGDDRSVDAKVKGGSKSWFAIAHRTPLPFAAASKCDTSSSSNTQTTRSDEPAASTKKPSRKVDPPIEFKPAKRPDKATLESLGSGTMWGYIDAGKAADNAPPSLVTEKEPTKAKPPAAERKKRPTPPQANKDDGKPPSPQKKGKTDVPPSVQQKPTKAPEVDIAQQMREKAKQAMASSIERKTWDARFNKGEVDIYADEIVLKAPSPHPITGKTEDKGRCVIVFSLMVSALSMYSLACALCEHIGMSFYMSRSGPMFEHPRKVITSWLVGQSKSLQWRPMVCSPITN